MTKVKVLKRIPSAHEVWSTKIKEVFEGRTIEEVTTAIMGGEEGGMQPYYIQLSLDNGHYINIINNGLEVTTGWDLNRGMSNLLESMLMGSRRISYKALVSDYDKEMAKEIGE